MRCDVVECEGFECDVECDGVDVMVGRVTLSYIRAHLHCLPRLPPMKPSLSVCFTCSSCKS